MEEKPYFDLLKNTKKGKEEFVDIFECLASFVIFSGEIL